MLYDKETLVKVLVLIKQGVCYVIYFLINNIQNVLYPSYSGSNIVIYCFMIWGWVRRLGLCETV